VVSVRGFGEKGPLQKQKKEKKNRRRTKRKIHDQSRPPPKERERAVKKEKEQWSFGISRLLNDPLPRQDLCEIKESQPSANLSKKKREITSKAKKRKKEKGQSLTRLRSGNS